MEHFKNKHKINKSWLKGTYVYQQVAKVYNTWLTMTKEEFESVQPCPADETQVICKMCNGKELSITSVAYHFGKKHNIVSSKTWVVVKDAKKLGRQGSLLQFHGAYSAYVDNHACTKAEKESAPAVEVKSAETSCHGHAHNTSHDGAQAIEIGAQGLQSHIDAELGKMVAKEVAKQIQQHLCPSSSSSSGQGVHPDIVATLIEEIRGIGKAAN